MRSSTRLYANPLALEDRARRRRIDDLVMLLDSVLVARRRVMLEVNASASASKRVVAVLPVDAAGHRGAAVRQRWLRGESRRAARRAPPGDPRREGAGGTDLVVSTFSQIVP